MHPRLSTRSVQHAPEGAFAWRYLAGAIVVISGVMGFLAFERRHEARSLPRTEARRWARIALGAALQGARAMEQGKLKLAYVITERGDKTFWSRIGVAFTNRDGSINVKLDAVPISGTLQIRDYEPRDDADAQARSRSTVPVASRALDEPAF